MDNEKDYGYDEAAELLGITTRTLRDWKSTSFIGYITKGKRTIRFPQSEIDRLKAGKRTEGGE